MSWDGRIYNKYRVEHTDGTPLKGKNYFVLRLDSDNPAEAARVTAAMRVYKGRLRNCDVGTPEEQSKRFDNYCSGNCGTCPCNAMPRCNMIWAQMPYEQEGE